MDWGLLLIFVLIAAYLAILIAAIGGSIDALGQPREAWERAGFQRNQWIWQAFGAFFLPAALIYSGLYFVRIRPRLIAAAGEMAAERAALVRPLGTGAVPAPQVDRVKIRMPLPVAATMVLPAVIGLSAGVVLIFLTDGSHVGLIWRELIPFAAGAVLVAIVNTGFALTLTSRDLVMSGLTRRRIAWSDVAAITQESQWGSRYVRLWTRSGRGRRLRVPFAQFGVGRGRFDADFAVLQQWWQTHATATG